MIDPATQEQLLSQAEQFVLVEIEDKNCIHKKSI